MILPADSVSFLFCSLDAVEEESGFVYLSLEQSLLSKHMSTNKVYFYSR